MSFPARALFPAVCLLVVCLAPPPFPHAPGCSRARAAGFTAGDFVSSEHCAECHKDIHRGWKNSIHAGSLRDPVFQQALQTAAAELGSGGRKLCLACHAPVALAIGDESLSDRITWEGVTCDFCHSVTGVKPGGALDAYRIEPGDVRQGPIDGASSNDHEVSYSPLFTRAEFCAGCHEYRPAGGEPVLTTYSEWLASPYPAEGTSCQSCHMGLVRADVVDPKIQRVASSTVNVHEMPGGHSLDQLLAAVRVGMAEARSGDSLVVRVRISNSGAGHDLPTGFPSRRVVLDVEVDSGSEHQRGQRTYGRTLLDEGGRAILRDDEVMVRPAAGEEDTRLKPREERLERFAFAVPASADASVTVRLRYVHTPLGEESPTTDQVFYSERRFLKGRG